MDHTRTNSTKKGIISDPFFKNLRRFHYLQKTFCGEIGWGGRIARPLHEPRPFGPFRSVSENLKVASVRLLAPIEYRFGRPLFTIRYCIRSNFQIERITLVRSMSTSSAIRSMPGQHVAEFLLIRSTMAISTAKSPFEIPRHLLASSARRHFVSNGVFGLFGACILCIAAVRIGGWPRSRTLSRCGIFFSLSHNRHACWLDG